MTSDLISVIIPVYNVEQYIDTCIASVVGQTYKSIEILVIDDGSTDGTLNAVSSWSRKDSRIRIFTQPNSGVSVARNMGLENVRGKYITFVDGDDWIDSRYLEDMLNEITRSEVDMVKSGLRFMNVEENKSRDFSLKTSEISSLEALKKLFGGFGFPSPVWGALYRSFLFENIRFEKGVKVGEDSQMTIKLLLSSRLIKTISKPYYFARIRKRSATRSGILLSDEYNLLEGITFPVDFNPQYLSTYRLRVKTSILLKNALNNISKQDFKTLYKNLDYKNDNTRESRLKLHWKWKILCLLGLHENGLYNLSKILRWTHMNPTF